MALRVGSRGYPPVRWHRKWWLPSGLTWGWRRGLPSDQATLRFDLGLLVRATLGLGPQATPRAGFGTPRQRLPSGWKPRPGFLGLELQDRFPGAGTPRQATLGLEAQARLPSVLATLWLGATLWFPLVRILSPGGLPSSWLLYG